METDYLGNEVKIGDTVLYVTRYSSSIIFKQGKVVGFESYTDRWGNTSNIVSIDNPENTKIAKLTAGRFIVINKLIE